MNAFGPWPSGDAILESKLGLAQIKNHWLIFLSNKLRETFEAPEIVLANVFGGLDFDREDLLASLDDEINLGPGVGSIA